jgi:hypothetical protein
MKPVNTLCRENAELLKVEAGDVYSYRCILKILAFSRPFNVPYHSLLTGI